MPPLLFCAEAEEHEVAARRCQADAKREANAAFIQRKSSRLAAKEAACFKDMLSKAKDFKAAGMASKGSPSLRRAVAAASLADGYPDFIPVPLLQDLGAACGVDPDALVLSCDP